MSIRAARPISDTARAPSGGGTNTWRTHTSGTTNLYAEIDETGTVDQADYIAATQPAGAPNGTVVAMKLGTVPTPPNRRNHKLHVVARFDPANLCTVCDTAMTVEIREGYVDETTKGTLIFTVSWTKSSWLTSGAEAFSYTMAEGTAAAITNYANLTLRAVAMAGTESDTLLIYQAWLTVPAQGGSGGGLARFPRSPIYGEVETLGSVNGAPVVQLLNPSNSTVKLVVYELGFEGGGGTSGLSSLCREDVNAAHRSEDPFQAGGSGTVRQGNLVRLDPSDVTAIQAEMRGINFTNEQFHGTGLGVPCEFQADHMWKGRPAADVTGLGIDFINPQWIRPPGSFPMVIMPGSAFELAWLVNSTGNGVRLFAVWDEVSL